MVTKQEEPTLSRMFSILSSKGRAQKALASLPVADTVDQLTDGKAPWFREWATRRDLDDAWWEGANLTAGLENVQVPVLLHGGWQDGFLRPTVAAYERLAERGIEVGLTIGP